MDLQERMDQLDDNEFLKFERVEPKLSRRPDIHAFLLLDKLMPADRDMIAAAEHDIIYLDVDAAKLNAVITDDQLLELKRCGVIYDSEGDGLAMFA